MDCAGSITDVTKPPDLSTLAGRLQWARAKCGLSQAEVAEAAGVAQGTIGNIESGERKEPRKIVAIAKAVGVRPEWLSERKGAPEDTTAPPPTDDLTQDERRLVASFRRLLRDDRTELLAEAERRATVVEELEARIRAERSPAPAKESTGDTVFSSRKRAGAGG